MMSLVEFKLKLSTCLLIRLVRYIVSFTAPHRWIRRLTHRRHNFTWSLCAENTSLLLFFIFFHIDNFYHMLEITCYLLEITCYLLIIIIEKRDIRKKHYGNVLAKRKIALFIYVFSFFLITTGDNCTLLNRFLPPDENSDKSDLGAQNRIGDNERPQITQRLGDNSNYTVGWI